MVVRNDYEVDRRDSRESMDPLTFLPCSWKQSKVISSNHSVECMGEDHLKWIVVLIELLVLASNAEISWHAEVNLLWPSPQICPVFNADLSNSV